MSNSLRPNPPLALRGYAPLIALLIVVGAFTTLVPTTGNEVLRANQTTVAGTDGALTPGGTALAGGDPAHPAAPGTPGSAGTSRVVTGCPDRTLQIPGDPYSPPCVTFRGDNGGATSKGVTADTITATWRLPNDAAQAAAVQSAAGNDIDISDSKADIVRTMQGIVDYINTHFQLYGRKIVLDVFDGRGSSSDELVGGGQDLANADAVTVADQKKAFIDASAGTAPYSDALARRGVVNIGIDYLSEEWYTERTPYVWPEVSCTQAIKQVGEYANKRLFGGTADNAGPDFVGKPRKIAIVAPENSYYQDCVKTLVADLGKENHVLAESLSYALDINTVSQDTSAIVAKLSADQITTVLMFTDPVSPLFFTAKATQQRYYPEWVVAGTAATDTDVVAQQYDQSQWKNAFGLRTFFAGTDREQSIAYAAFKTARPDQEPAGLSLYGIYDRLYRMALGIQLAGPNLTPTTFGAGYQSYTGGTGFYGTWLGSKTRHTYQVDAEEVYYDPNATSTFNGGKGAYITLSPHYQLGQWPRGKPPVPR